MISVRFPFGNIYASNMDLLIFLGKYKQLWIELLNFCLCKKCVPIVSFGAGMDFCGDLHFASFAPTRPQHDSMMRFSVFLTFSLGTCAENKQKNVLAGEVSQKWEIAFPPCMAIKKKTSPMQHGNVKNDVCDTSRARMRCWKHMFLCCRFGSIWGKRTLSLAWV